MKKIILGLGVAGLLFAGYLSAYSLFSTSCPLNESCPYFIGYPSCYYGFAMYLVITVAALALVLKKIGEKAGLQIVALVSFLGILFAGYFTLQELPLLFERGIAAYTLGLPSCAYGLVFYIAIFVLSLVAYGRVGRKV